ncbi:MAG: GatB/YqeY domain-containing protein [Solirubrobacterales bacterium]
MLTEARESLPELPAARMARYESELGLDEAQARLLAGDPGQAGYFEAVAAATGDAAEPRVVANWVTGDLTAALRATEIEEDYASPTVAPATLADLVKATAVKQISHGSGRKVLTILVAGGEADVAAIVEREGLAQMGGDDTKLAGIVAAAIEADPAAAEQIRSGNGKAIGAIVGAVMRETKGRADGGEVNRLIREQLGL